METSINKLLEKCLENNINFDCHSEIGRISLYVIEDGEHIFDAGGYVKDWDWEKPTDVLTRMHTELDLYLEESNNEG